MSDISSETGRVVVGVDGSPSSDRAVRWGAEQARLEARGLTLLHAVDPEPFLLRRGTAQVREKVLLAVHHASQELLARDVALATSVAPEVEVTGRFCDDDPRQALIAVSEYARMVVLGARGRGPIASLVLGSVSAARGTTRPLPDRRGPALGPLSRPLPTRSWPRSPAPTTSPS